MIIQEPHPNREELLRLKNMQLTAKKCKELLEHLSNCEHCCKIYSTLFCEDELLPYEEQTLLAQKQQHYTQRKLFYKVRVLLATAAALGLVLSAPLESIALQGEIVPREEYKIFEQEQTIPFLFPQESYLNEVSK